MAKQETKKGGAGTAIMSCSCTHAFQDERYGKHMRVFNAMAGTGWKCTVCGAKK